MEFVMSKKMLIDAAHSEEIRIGVLSDDRLDKFDFETASKAQVKGNIYLAKVIRVEPSLQAAFVDYGGNRHGFLSFSEISHDYFQIPVGDREELDAHLQNAIAAYAAETEQTLEEIEPKEIAKLRYQFYRKYKIQEVIKKRQIMLVQVTKEERGNKGAAITTYISLAGRYCVLMPNTAKGSGVSRKVTNSTDRMKLKKIVSGLSVPNGSVVIRTAGVGHTKSEITKDFDYLMKLWDEIRATTLQATAPCLIHEESSLIKRSIRDMYTKDIEEIVVEGEEGYKTAKNFMKKLMPSHSKKVKFYDDKNIPLFSKYKLNEQINQIYSTRVDLPSGGYLIINNTEALISIDVNSGKSTKERNIAGTALKTNLEAAAEIARQCRLRDLAGLIVVDFIDMDEKRNNAQVEKHLRDALRNDKAKIQVGTISNFGLLEFSRQRLRSSIADANMVVCHYCRGTGFMWADESLAVQLLRRIEESCSSGDIRKVNVTLSPNVAMYLLNNKRSFISAIEARGNLQINFIPDPHIAPIDFRIEPIIEKPQNVEKLDAQEEAEEEVVAEQKAKPSNKKPQKNANNKNKKASNNEEQVAEAVESADNNSEKNANEQVEGNRLKSVARRKTRKPNLASEKEEISSSDNQTNSESPTVMSIPVKKTSKKHRPQADATNSKHQDEQKRSVRIIEIDENPQDIQQSAESTVEENKSEQKDNQRSSNRRQQWKKRNHNNRKNSKPENATTEKNDALFTIAHDEKPELKAGTVDFNIEQTIGDYRQIVSEKIVPSYNLVEESRLPKSVDIGIAKKKTGWWQRLLKKPQE